MHHLHLLVLVHLAGGGGGFWERVTGEAGVSGGEGRRWGEVREVVGWDWANMEVKEREVAPWEVEERKMVEERKVAEERPSK